jgi:nucleoside phosphorylase
MVSWTRADVVILTAIELEYAAVKRVEAGLAPGGRWIEEKHNGLPVALGVFVARNGRHLHIAVGRAPDMGRGSATTTLLPLVDALRPSCIAMCGVCAGRPGKTHLGDVVVGERLYDYDTGKWKEVGFEADPRTYSLPAPWKIAAEQFDPKARFGGEAWWQGRPVPYQWQEAWVLTMLHKGIEDPKALPECQDRCPQWPTVIESLWTSGDLKRNTGSLTKKGRDRAAGMAFKYSQLPDLSPCGTCMPFQLHVQPIGSGSAVREDVDVWGFITPHMRKTLALEMEASALADIVRARAHHDPIEAVVMKGVMDFANHGRDDHFKDYAARASAECLIAFLRDLQLSSPLRERPGHGGNIEASSPVATGTAEIASRMSVPLGVASPEVLERLARMKREVAGVLKARPRPFAQLATRIGGAPEPEVLPDRLVSLRGSVVAEHILAVFDEQPSTPEYDADRDALQSVLLTVLPYVLDWQAEVAACCARGDGEEIAVELRYRSDTIAEAVMAGWTGRRCAFELKAGTEPYGVGAVQLPATSQTTLFTSKPHLLEGVVNQLMYQLGVGGLNLQEQRTRVQAELRFRGQRGGPQRMRYYFLFRDAASPENPETLWGVAKKTLHGNPGLPSLVLVRMQGRLSDDEADLETRVGAILKARTRPRS